MAVVFTFDETFDGLLSCVFHSYSDKIVPERVCSENNLQGDFTVEFINIKTDSAKAERVRRGIIKTASWRAYYLAYTAFMADAEDIYTRVFDFIRLCFEYKKNVLSLLKNDSVLAVEKGSYRATHEADKLKGFLRFRELEGGIMYGEIEPCCNILEILAHHFADRFPLTPFIIRDVKRGLSAVYNGQVTITEMPLENIPKISDDEEEYQKLWRQFIDSVNIKERKNPKCQRTMMPKKYWRYMLETYPDTKKRGV